MHSMQSSGQRAGTVERAGTRVILPITVTGSKAQERRIGSDLEGATATMQQCNMA
jgi:hypothetical protein